MADQFDDPGALTSPAGKEATSDPRHEIARREMQQLIASTLSEIQVEQGRHAERFDGFTKSLNKLADKIDALTTGSALNSRSLADLGTSVSDARKDVTGLNLLVAANKTTLDRLEPRIEAHHGLYNKLSGAFWGISLLILACGGLLYWTNSARLDKLMRLLDSPTIDRLIKKDGK
ncbi:hypothetical protein [Methylobacterium cerastii]|uniref:hypothetical protein n=1 Tax=Methylobacterium cerastii TaxID=932741 RepID=UPI001EE2F7CB|nr:hypothetical protein [Methylobacterium cerastii]